MLFAEDVDSEQFYRYMLGELTGLAFGLTTTLSQISHFVVEDITHMGMAVGKSVFDTAKLIGDLRTAWRITRGGRDNPAFLLSRQDVKTLLCGGAHFNDEVTGRLRGVTDAMVKKALLSRFPATGWGSIPQIGTKDAPGPLRCMRGKKHAWSALGLAVTHAETIGMTDK